MNATARLLDEQQSLLMALLGDRDDTGLWAHLKTGDDSSPPELLSQARRGLLAYRANGLALAERALLAAYPVLAQLTGTESFAPMARHFWLRHPPSCGDMACWGEDLPMFIEAAEQLAGEPFLADVARVEWALHGLAAAPDAVPDLASFALLSDGLEAPVSLVLSPGVFLLASPYPVASLVLAHQQQQPELSAVAALLHAGVAENVQVWRQGFKPRVAALAAGDYAMVSALLAGSALDAAVAAALNAAPHWHFSDWLSGAVHTGLVTGACRHPAAQEFFQQELQA